MLSISNTSALAAISTLTEANRRVDDTQQRLGTGLRVSGARDDAAVFAVAQNVRATQKASRAALDSLRAARAKMSLAETAAHDVYDNLTQLKGELANYIGAKGDATAQTIYQDNFNALLRQIEKSGESTAVGTQANPALNQVAVLNGLSGPVNTWSDGKYLYASERTSGKLDVFEFDGTNFTLKTSFNIGSPEGIWGDGKYIYVASVSGQVAALEFDGTNFTQKAVVTGLGTPRNMWGDGQNLFVTEYTGNKLTVLNFDGNIFTTKSSYSTGLTQPLNVWSDGTYTYLTEYGAGELNALKFDGTNFTQVGVMNTGLSLPFGVWGDGQYQYVIERGSNEVSVLEFDGSNFVTKNVLTPGLTTPDGIYGDGRYLYISEFTSNRLKAFEVNYQSNFSIVAGPNGERANYTTHKMTAGTLGLGLTANGDFNMGAGGFTRIDNALARAGKYAAEIGANIRDLDNRITFLQSQLDATDEGLGALVDADMARTQATMVAAQVKQQLGIDGLRNTSARHRDAILSIFA